MKHAYLTGELGSESCGFTSDTVLEALEAAAEDHENVTFHLNSPGGDVGDAVMIDAMFRAFAAEQPDISAIVEVDGYAASAASFAFLNASKIVAHPSSMFMIHDPSSFSWGKAEELRKTAEVLDKCRDAIVSAYVRRTGRYADEIKVAMAEETWFTADEAIRFGLADELLETDATLARATAESTRTPVADARQVECAVHNLTTNRCDSEQMIAGDAPDEGAAPSVEATEGSAGDAPAYGAVAGHVYQIATKESD